MTQSSPKSLATLVERSRRYLAQEIDPDDEAELARLIAAVQHGDQASILDLSSRFEGPLRFGTAGIRGVMGAGESRMNRVLIRRVSWGLARHLLDVVPDAIERGIVLARDGRHRSQVFLEDAAGVFAACGLPLFVLEGPQPTPLAAFAVLHFGAAAGVVVTASHNPKDYNGYKAYWGNGAQIIPPTDSAIASAIDDAPSVAQIPCLAFPRLGECPRSTAGLVDAYLAGLPATSASAAARSQLTIAYSAMHGVGQHLVQRVADKAGCTLHSVAAQALPDPDFPTVAFPNPEEEGAMQLVLELASEKRCDAAMVNDPDADRLAAAVPDRHSASGYRTLDGDQLGILLAHHLLNQTEPSGPTPLVVTTVVSSRMLSRLAERRRARYLETLTGFKWIANQSIEIEQHSDTRFLFGYEEAIGYSVGSTVRDKDGISALFTLADMLAEMKSNQEDPLDALNQLYQELGHHIGSQKSIVLTGHSGQQQMREAVERLRNQRLDAIGDEPVSAIWDLRAGTYRLTDGSVGTPNGGPSTETPRADVLVFEMADGGRCAVRPSGTEPKIKFYLEVVEPFGPESYERGRARIDRLGDQLIAAAGV